MGELGPTLELGLVFVVLRRGNHVQIVTTVAE